MTGVNELNDQLEGVTVIKRNGKKVDFDGAKIALAIKKGFDSVEVDDDRLYRGIVRRLAQLCPDIAGDRRVVIRSAVLGDNHAVDVDDGDFILRMDAVESLHVDLLEIPA